MDDTNTTILELKNFVEDFVQEREWSQFHNAKNLSMALTIEAGELMDIFKWNTCEECESMMSEKNTRQDATDELADIMIYAIAFANRNNINISNAIDQKMIKNRVLIRKLSAVETLGSERASGDNANLQIREITADRYIIKEYDGRESVITPDEIKWVHK